MKRLFLFSLVCCFSFPILYGQEFYPDFYPTAFTYPKTGMNRLREENPYLLSLKPEGTGNDWRPYYRYLFAKAPNTPYTGINIMSYWVKEWKDLDEYKSDFVLDTQNRIDMAFVYEGKMSYKRKFAFNYNAQNKVSRVACYASFPDTIDYQIQFISFFQYDQTGKQIKDSIIDYSSGKQPRVTYHHYIGNNLSESDQLYSNTGDTIDKYVYTYSGNLNTSVSYLVWDTVNSQWSLTNSDTFEYNAQQQLIKRVSAYKGVDLGDGKFKPRWQEIYQYTDQNKLREFVSYNGNGLTPYSKIEINYSSSGRPEVGFEYPFKNGGWSSTPSTKYLFEVQTGIHQSQKLQSTFKVYPNPTASVVTVESNSNSPLTLCELYDYTGKHITSFPDIATTRTIDISKYPEGIYYLMVQNFSGETVTHKLAIAH